MLQEICLARCRHTSLAEYCLKTP